MCFYKKTKIEIFSLIYRLISLTEDLQDMQDLQFFALLYYILIKKQLTGKGIIGQYIWVLDNFKS